MHTYTSLHVKKDDDIHLEHWTTVTGKTYYCLSIGNADIFIEDKKKLMKIYNTFEKPVVNHIGK